MIDDRRAALREHWRPEKRSDFRWVAPDELAQLPCSTELPSLVNKVLPSYAGLFLRRKIGNEQPEQQGATNARISVLL